jgi:hypothetical protein
VKAEVGTLLAEAGKRVSEVQEARRKEIDAITKTQQEQIERLQRQTAERLRTPPPPQSSAPQSTQSAPSLECITKVSVSQRSTYPIATATLDANEIQAGYKVVSGGCSVPTAGQEGVPHNIPIIRSIPDGSSKGWVCAAGDPPNIPVAARVTAYALACRVSRT